MLGLSISGKYWNGFLILAGLSAIALLIYTFLKKQTSLSPGSSPQSKPDYPGHVLSLLILEGFTIQTARMITAQAGFETGNFTSAIFKENNNCFGMKLPVQRRTLAVGENRGHAVFRSIADSVADYRLYYNARQYPQNWMNIEAFLTALKAKGYFEADLNQYIAGTKVYYKKYFG